MPKGIYNRTEEGRNNMSKARLGKVPWNKNICGYTLHSEEWKQELSSINKERYKNEDARKKLSISSKKAWENPELRRINRINAIKQHKENGIDFPAVDKGAMDYFQRLNMYYDLNIEYPNYEIKNLGYFLDGYDKVSNVAYEYDSKRHLIPSVKENDLIRQKEIIDYYKSIGNPLSAFYRINATCVGSTEMIDVLKIKNEPVGS